MNKIKKLLIIFFTFCFAFKVFAKDAPASYADLAERLMPSVVNISTTTTVTTYQSFPRISISPRISVRRYV